MVVKDVTGSEETTELATGSLSLSLAQPAS